MHFEPEIFGKDFAVEQKPFGKSGGAKSHRNRRRKISKSVITVFDIAKRFLPEVSLSGFLRGSGFRRPPVCLPWSIAGFGNFAPQAPAGHAHKPTLR